MKITKEGLREQAKSKYREYLMKKKVKKRENERNRYQNMSKEYKQRLKEYQKQYYKAKNTIMHEASSN